MNIKKNYSAGAVKHAFWFMEFRKVVTLRNERYSSRLYALLNSISFLLVFDGCIFLIRMA